jgi:CitMHS family citrate-Mg2+:H+ or citrate-Ca2+:H+ symporter
MITGSGGIGSVAATGVMFIFSILFLGSSPMRAPSAPSLGADPQNGQRSGQSHRAHRHLAMIVHLDGSGAVTFLICNPAPGTPYDAIGMKRTTLPR